MVDTTGALDILGRMLRGAVGEIALVGIVGEGIARDGIAGGGYASWFKEGGIGAVRLA